STVLDIIRVLYHSPGSAQHRAIRRAGDAGSWRDPPAHPRRAPGDHRAPPPSLRRADRDRRFRARNSGRHPRQALLPARVGARGRYRPGPVHRPDLHRAARRHDRIREPSGPHRLHHSPAGRRLGRRAERLKARKPRLFPANSADPSAMSDVSSTASYSSPAPPSSVKPVWVIDDDRSIRWVFEKALAREGIAHRSFPSVADALAALNDSVPQVVVSDIRMSGESGLDLLAKLKERYPQLPVIIMTAYSDLDSAVAAFQGGAFEYLPKPFDVDIAVELIRRALDESRKRETTAEAEAPAPEILGQAPAMQEVFRAI